MFKNTKLNLALFFIGLLIVIVAVASWFLFPEWRTTPHGLIQLIVVALVGVIGFFGNLTQVLSYFRPQPPAEAGPTAVSQGENAQSVVGNHNRPVQTGGGDYIENQTVLPAPPEAPAPLFDVLPPSAAAGYVDRGVEVAVEAALLGRQGQPLALLNGPHGIGKTEAALQISRQLKGEFEHTLWIPLGSRPTDQVLPDYLRACGIKPPERKEEQIQALKAFLVQHRLLVVLDDLCAQQSADLEILLPPAPCAALLTSCIQQPSHLIPVNHSFLLEQMDREQGHALLENVLNGMVLSAEPEAVDDLIVKCAGNPLALEIAARRIQFMQGTPCPIQAYLEKLNKNLGELRSGHDSHLDLFAVFDQTYTALSPAEQLAFRTLSGCAPAGFSTEAARALWQIDPAPSEAVLWQLQNVYFLKPVADSRTRFRLHDLLYEYAGTKLSAAERETANQRLAGWLIALFEKHFTDNVSNAPEVALELDNLRQAVAWATQGQNAELLARLATQPRNWLLNFFRNYDEWLVWLQTALAGKIADPSLRANTLQAIGDVQQFKDQTDAALASYSAALDLFRSVGSRLGEANTLQAIGDVQQFKKQTDDALASYSAALDLFRAIADCLGEANTLRAIGDVQQFKKQNDDALASYSTALTLFRSVADRLGEAYTLKAIGDVQQFKDQNDDALASYSAALDLFRSVADRLGEAYTLQAIGDVQQFKKQNDAALVSYSTALTLFRSVGSRLGEANTLRAIGDVQQFKKQNDDALASYSAALTLFRSVADRLGEANTLASQSRLLVQIGRTAEAEMKLQEALAVREQIQNRYGMGADYGNFALALLAQKEFALAAVYAQKARAVFQSIPLPDYVESVDQLLAKIDQLSQASSDS